MPHDPSLSPFASALRSALAESRLSQSDLRQRLADLGTPVSAAALSYWLSGRSQPERLTSLEALSVLEDVLDLEQGTLSELLAAPRPRGRVGGEHRSQAEYMPQEGVVASVLRELGFLEADDLPQELFVHEVLHLDSSSDRQRLVFTLYVRALRPGRPHLPAVTAFDEHERNVEPTVIPIEGCHIGRRVQRPAERAYGAEIVLDTHLEAGQTAVCRYEVEVRGDHVGMTVATYSVARRTHDMLIEVEFTGPDVPVACVAVREDANGESVTPVRRNELDRIRVAAQGFGPGMLGLRWTWDATTSGTDG